MVPFRLEVVRHAPFAEHAVPTLAVVGRLDQLIGVVAQEYFVVGQVELRDRGTATAGCVAADPGVDAVGPDRGSHPAEIAVRAADQDERAKGRVAIDAPPQAAK